MSECMFYKFQWRALHLTHFRKSIFQNKKKSDSKIAETRVVPKYVGEENNSNNYENQKLNKCNGKNKCCRD
jgi:hypothetical protein